MWTKRTNRREPRHAQRPHLKGFSRGRDVTEQVGEQSLSGSTSLKHSRRGPTNLHPQF